MIFPIVVRISEPISAGLLTGAPHRSPWTSEAR